MTVKSHDSHKAHIDAGCWETEGTMTPEPTQRLAPILGLATGILLLLACLTVQVLSQQPPVSTFGSAA